LLKAVLLTVARLLPSLFWSVDDLEREHVYPAELENRTMTGLRTFDATF